MTGCGPTGVERLAIMLAIAPSLVVGTVKAGLRMSYLETDKNLQDRESEGSAYTGKSAKS